jgi:hypothetical protein
MIQIGIPSPVKSKIIKSSSLEPTTRCEINLHLVKSEPMQDGDYNSGTQYFIKIGFNTSNFYIR